MDDKLERIDDQELDGIVGGGIHIRKKIQLGSKAAQPDDDDSQDLKLEFQSPSQLPILPPF